MPRFRPPPSQAAALTFALLAAALPSTRLAAQIATEQVSFARDVLPILSDRCFSCHGPDARARRADLRLDDRDSASEVLAPGEPERSELVRRITAAGEDHMPPVDSGLALSEAEIATLRHWIAQGARWEAHWAFVPPRADEPPPARDPGWPQNGIDRFVLARLADAGLTPNPPAPPAALLRRVTLDLTGLPPSPEDVATFAADPSDAAYERAVDRLLASPHYGERMAWPWLEAARYADTDGYQDDPTRTAWPWRDWLVRALNDNLPFDRFTIAMLAGDLLPDATPDQRLATAFLRNNAHNGEGGRIAEETRIENVFDRTETTATVWLGLTFECARCHDHKFDPITQRDYYGLFAFFDQTSETGEGRRRGALAPTMRCDPDPNAERRLGDIARELAELESRLFGDDPELDAEEHDWELVSGEHVRTAHAAMRPSQPGRWERCGPFEVAERDADTLFGHEFPPEWGGGAWQPDMGLTDGEVLALPTGQYALYFRRTIAVPSTRRMTLSLGSDDGLQLWCNGELVLQNDTRRGATPDQERAELRLRAGPNELLVKIVNTGGIGGIYCRAVDETVPDLPAAIARALAQPSAERDDTARRSLRRHFRAERVAGWLDLERQRDALLAEQRALERRFLTVSVMDELPTDRRRTTHVLERGSYRQPRDAVTADTPGFLPPLPGDAAADRLALARWLVAADHPLTARVAVNRAWQTFFGRGLVATSEDFGRQGERPTHPALLDWLARRFVASGWDVKALHRLIVTSATYRQSAAADGADFAADPHNERLARSSRRRLPAWMLRDQALALGGQLAARLGGAPVRPYQPAGVWAEATFGTIRYQPGSGDELHRRSLYTFWRRIVGPTMLFDTPDRLTCVVRHAVTNTPLHALTTLNETGFVEAARGLAERAFERGEGAEQRLAWLFRAATARCPEPTELALLVARYEAALARFAATPAAADELLAVGASAVDPSHPRAQLAATAVVASIVLNLDEVLTRP